MNAFFALRALLFAGEVLVGSLPIMALAFLARLAEARERAPSDLRRRLRGVARSCR